MQHNFFQLKKRSLWEIRVPVKSSDTKKSDIFNNGLKQEKPTALIFGGSQGALKINQAVTEALPIFATRDYQVLYASGERYFNEIKKETKIDLSQLTNVSVAPYIDKMAAVMVCCDLLVGRAGATSIAEFTALVYRLS